jgi:hypothetical protein
VEVYPTVLAADNNTVKVKANFAITDVMVISKLGIQQRFDLYADEPPQTQSALVDAGKGARIVVYNLAAGHYFIVFGGVDAMDGKVKVSKLIVKEE